MPTVSFNVSPAMIARAQAGCDKQWPDDAPHTPADVKAKMWQVFASIIRQVEQRELDKQVPVAPDAPMDDGV